MGGMKTKNTPDHKDATKARAIELLAGQPWDVLERCYIDFSTMNITPTRVFVEYRKPEPRPKRGDKEAWKAYRAQCKADAEAAMPKCKATLRKGGVRYRAGTDYGMPVLCIA